MQPETKKLLLDIQRAGTSLVEFTAGKSFADYTADPMLRSAVERQFEIVGEALNRLAKADKTTASRIADHGRIIGFRNALIHGYDAIADEVVWDILQSKLPGLQREVATILEEDH